MLGATVGVLGYAIAMIVDFPRSDAGLQYVTDDEWIPELGIRYSLGVDGLNLFLVALTALLWVASALWAFVRGAGHHEPQPAWTTGRASSSSTWRWPRPRCSAPSWPRTSRCSSSSST